MDPPIDHNYPARIAEGIRFDSDGFGMNAIVYEAAGPGPHPTALVLHGFPGSERNLDLAQAIRRAGWNAVFFHYRGAWGSEGRFSFTNALDDVRVVVKSVGESEFAVAHRIDPTRIAVVGHSMGGFAALISASELPEVCCVVSIAGANLGLTARVATEPSRVEELAETLEGWVRGPIPQVSGRDLIAEVVDNVRRFDTTEHAASLARKPVLLVAGSRDEFAPAAFHHQPLVDAILAQGPTHLEEIVLDADHAFSDQRISLAGAVVSFLVERCP